MKFIKKHFCILTNIDKAIMIRTNDDLFRNVSILGGVNLARRDFSK